MPPSKNDKELILVVDDEPDMLDNCRKVLEKEGYVLQTAGSAKEAGEILSLQTPALVLTDLKIPDGSGLEVLKQAKSIHPACVVILMTAYGTVETAVEAMKDGAYDYILKPFTNEQLKKTVRKGIEVIRLRQENTELKQKLGLLEGLENLVGASPQMKAVREMIRRVSPTEASILIQGESGTGKEVVARCLHMNSRHKDGPFVPVDCAALPETLLETELFGHDRGAFTDARHPRAGLFEFAEGGTIFLDEISEMPMPLQAKLLRVLQERQVRRLGSNRWIPINARVLSATNRDPAECVRNGKFREDLFFRLNVIEFRMPPLREREGDIPILAKHFFRRFCDETHSPLRGISPAAMEALENHPWPGNVRELANWMERAVSLAEGLEIVVGDLPETPKRNV